MLGISVLQGTVFSVSQNMLNYRNMYSFLGRNEKKFPILNLDPDLLMVAQVGGQRPDVTAHLNL